MSPDQLSFETLPPFSHIFLYRLKCLIAESEIGLESWMCGKARGCSVGINPFKILLLVLLGVWSLFPCSLLEQPLTDSVHPYCWIFLFPLEIFSLGEASKLGSFWLAGKETRSSQFYTEFCSQCWYFSVPWFQILSCRKSFYLCFILFCFWLSWSTTCSVWALPMI